MPGLIRRAAVLCLLCLPVLHLPAQSSHGYTFHKLADANSLDATNTPLPGTPNSNLAFTLTNDTAVLMTLPVPSSAATVYCNATGLFTTPINGGAITPLVLPTTPVESTEPNGTLATLCQQPAIWGSNVIYGAAYTPTGGSLRNGYFYTPLDRSGVSKEFVATGDPGEAITAVGNGYAPFQYPSGPSASNPQGAPLNQNNFFSTDVLSTPGPGPQPQLLTTIGYAGATPVIETITSYSISPQGSCTFEGRTQNFALLSLDPYGVNNSDTTLNVYAYSSFTDPSALGSPLPQFFAIPTNITTEIPNYCPSTVLYDSYTGSAYTALPGEPAPTSPSHVEPAPTLQGPFISRGKVYFAATTKLDDGSTFAGIYQADPSHINTPIKLVTTRDSLPGISTNLSTCPDGSAAVGAPLFLGAVGYSQAAIVFGLTQSIKNCTTGQSTSQGGIYAYNLSDQSISTVLPLYTASSTSNAIDTTLGVWPIYPTQISVDGHLLISVINEQNSFGPSASTLYSVFLGQKRTTLTLNTPASFAAPVTLIATLAFPPNLTTTPTGSVHFYDGSMHLGDETPDASGNVSLGNVTLPAGSHTLKAVYDGDDNYMGADSNTIPITITGDGTPDYSIAVTPPSATIKAGQSAMFTFTVTPINDFNQPLTFSCSGLPANAKCIFSPATITPGTTNSTTLTVQTNVATSSVTMPSLHRALDGIAFGTLLGVPLLFFRRRRLPAVLFALLLSTSLVMFSGCGGSSSPSTTTTSQTTPTTPVTPTGTSTVTVAAGTGHAVSLSLTIQ